jgi:hypothetical protein
MRYLGALAGISGRVLFLWWIPKCERRGSDMSWKRDDAVWARIGELRAQGGSYKKIGDEIGLCETAVRYALATMSGAQMNRDNDHSTEKLNRMEILAYRISKRKVRLVNLV